MQLVMWIVGSALSVYSILIFIRIMLSWWSGVTFGRVYEFLKDITDPYLLWFRRFRFLRLGNIDLSPIAALAVLAIANNLALVMGNSGRITLGFVFALALQVVWSAVSFVLGFFAVIIGLRLLAYVIRANIYRPFWQIVGSISEPVLYRINRIIFRRPVSFVRSMVIAIAVLAGLILLMGWGVGVLSGLLTAVPKTA
jgi:YggT family protein